MVTATVKPTLTQPAVSKTNTPLSSLGPGTLILANGSIVPVLPPAAPLIPQNPTVLTNSTPFLLNQPTVVVVTTNSITQTTISKTTQVTSRSVSFTAGSKTLPCIKPKRCTTKTVQANKVPIPALSSRYSNSCVVFNAKSQQQQQQQKVQQKKVVEPKEKGTGKVESGNGGVVLKRKLDGKAEGDASAAKQRKESEELKVSTNVEAASEKIIATEASVTEDKVEQKRVSTSYSIDSICKEKGEKSGLEKPKSGEKEVAVPTIELQTKITTTSSTTVTTTTTTTATNTNTTENQVLQQNVTPIDTVSAITEVPQTSLADSISKVVEIPENVLKEIETSENTNKNEKSDKELEISLQHSELSNDIFASLQVQSGGHNPESTSPTAAFLLAFPLVSTLTGVKVSEVIEEDNSDSQRGTPTLLQIGTMDTTKPTQSSADNLTPSLLNLDHFSFFSSKDICNSFYQPFDSFLPLTTTTTTTVVSTTTTSVGKSDEKKKNVVVDTNANKSAKVVYEPPPPTTKAVTSGFVGGDSFSGGKTDVRQPKINQTFNNCNQITSETNKNVNVKPVVTQESHVVQQQQQSHVGYNAYNINYPPVGAVYNTTNNLERKQQPLNQKNKCNSSTMNSYSMNTTRPTQTIAQCNTFNPFAETVKYTAASSSVCCYNTVTKPYIESLYTNPSTYSYNCQPDVSFSQGNYTTHKNTQKPEEKSYYGMNMNYNNSSYNSGNTFSNNYCQMHNKDKFNVQTNKNKTANQTRPPVNWMTTPDIRHQTATNNDYFLPFGKELDNIPSSMYPTATFSVASSTQTTYFNSTASIYPTPDLTYSFPEAKKQLDSAFPSVPISTFQRSDMDENQFTWSPTKFPQLLDPSHSFVSSALPTLVGDLALGTSTTSVPFADQKMETKNKDTYNRQKDMRRNKSSNYESHVNFFSVSQLVDHNKAETVPARTTSRRNSGNRSNKPVVQQKTVKRSQKDTKDNHNYQSVPCSKPSEKHHMKPPPSNNNYNLQHNNQDWISEAAKQNHQVKNPPSSYSAEALIGHQPMSEDVAVAKQRNATAQAQCGYSTSNSLPVSFLTDNVIPYFPPVELQQDSSFIQNQNCHQNNSFSHNFPSASIQSNTYSSASLIASTPSITTNYLPTTNFMSDIGTTHDYNFELFSHTNTSAGRADNKTCMKNSNTLHKQINRQEERNKAIPVSGSACSGSSSNNFTKKTKKKPLNESNVPGFVDFGFLSMPAAINSPILPDDFHANLLPPPTPQLYSCKNPLYNPTKQNTDLNAGAAALLPLPPVPPVSRSNIQHPEISPSVNNVATSMNNFFMSAILPEINKVSVLQV